MNICVEMYWQYILWHSDCFWNKTTYNQILSKPSELLYPYKSFYINLAKFYIKPLQA